MNKRDYLTHLPKATAFVNSMYTAYYRRINRLDKQKQAVAWVDVNFPSYLLCAMDIEPVFPQVQAAFQAQRKKIRKMLHELESKWELPPTLCSEVKGMIGAIVYGNDVDFQLPHPDVLISANSSCNIVTGGLRYLSQHLGQELLFADFPYVYNEISAAMIDYTTERLLNVIKKLENKTGRKFDIEKYKTINENVLILGALIEGISQLNRAAPSPVDMLDMFLFGTASMSLFNEEKILDLFVLLYNEISEQAELNKKYYKGGENLRLLWHYLPIYAQKKFFTELFDKYGLSISFATYFAFPEARRIYDLLDFQYPLTSRQIENMRLTLREKGFVDNDLYTAIRRVAESHLKTFPNRNSGYKEKIITQLIEEYKIDGVIMHSDRSCRAQTLPQYELRRYLVEELKIPVLLFDADSMDERFFSSSQIVTRFEAFIEKLYSRHV